MAKSVLLLSLFAAVAALAQDSGPRHNPLYKVTVVSHTTKAINYGHRTEPTRIGFRGTVLMPEAKGEAVVESKRGVVEVDAKFQNVGAPQRFGLQYLTYVLWAITPDGKPQNLGELVLNGSNKGKLHVAVNLQSFALIVTAEPYYSVPRPSGVVIMENRVLPETVGKIEEVDAKYDLLPVKPFNYDIQAGQARARNQGPKLSMDQYEAVQALYQALNAIQMANAIGADQVAGDIMRKARDLYEQARQQQAAKADPKQIVATAREAVQAAEDARAITQRQNNAQPQSAAAETAGSR